MYCDIKTILSRHFRLLEEVFKSSAHRAVGIVYYPAEIFIMINIYYQITIVCYQVIICQCLNHTAEETSPKRTVVATDL